MHNSFDVDQIVGYIKNIFDCNRCGICDNSDGSRLRYPCGHTACDKCVSVAEECLICLTQASTPNKTVQDNVLIKRCQNAATLLDCCQATFNTDVSRRQRISEKLKVEKEVFPDCIQAPVKYSNKRKSLYSSFENQSKRLFSFPGEQVSFNGMKMDKSSSSVHAWLNKYEKSMARKPLGNINVNQQLRKTTKLPVNKTRLKEARLKENNRKELNTKLKRNHRNSAHDTIKSPSCLDKYVKSANEFESTKIMKTEMYTLQRHDEKQNNDYNDESGIVIDDGTIIIDDSQSQVIDKDKEACLAVQEVEKNFQDDSTIVSLDRSENVCNKINETTLLRNNNKNHKKVPFYKKSYMVETCLLCKNDSNKNSIKNAAQCKDNVSITIESNSFTATIQVCNTEQSIQNIYQKSALVQTDICLTDEPSNNDEDKDTIYITDNKPKTKIEAKQFSPLIEDVNNENILSQNMFTDEVKITDKCQKQNQNEALEEIESVSHESVNKTKGVIIEESDSDFESSGGSQIKVTAEIHRSCDQSDYGILTEVQNQRKHASRKRRAARGYTPTSTDSSEKENFNPNRVMKTKFGKKYKK